MELFSGMYEHQVDDKGRIRIPAKVKKGLDSYPDKSYSFARGVGGCIYIFPNSVLSDLLEELSEERLGDTSKAARMFFSSVFPAEEDAQGRVVLPSRLKALAGITKDVVTVGMGKHLEIWDAAKYFGDADDDYDTLFKTLGI